MNSPMRFGLIGTGRIGQVHASSVARTEGAELTMVADVFVEGAKKTAEQYGGVATADGWPWVALLVVFAALFGVGGTLAFGSLIEE